MKKVKVIIASSFFMPKDFLNEEVKSLIDRINAEAESRKTDLSVDFIGDGELPEDIADCDIIFLFFYAYWDFLFDIRRPQDLAIEKLNQAEHATVISYLSRIRDINEMVSDICLRLGDKYGMPRQRNTYEPYYYKNMLEAVDILAEEDPEMYESGLARIHRSLGDITPDRAYYEAALELYRRIAERSPEKYGDDFLELCEHIRRLFNSADSIGCWQIKAKEPLNLYKDSYYLSARTVNLYSVLMRAKLVDEQNDTEDIDVIYADNVADFCESFAKLLIHLGKYREAQDIIGISSTFRKYLEEEKGIEQDIRLYLEPQFYIYCGFDDVASAEECLSRMYSGESSTRRWYDSERFGRWRIYKLYEEHLQRGEHVEKKLLDTVDWLIPRSRTCEDDKLTKLTETRKRLLSSRTCVDVFVCAPASADRLVQNDTLRRHLSGLNNDLEDSYYYLSFEDLFDNTEEGHKARSCKIFSSKLFVFYIRRSLGEKGADILSTALIRKKNDENIEILILYCQSAKSELEKLRDKTRGYADIKRCQDYEDAVDKIAKKLAEMFPGAK